MCAIAHDISATCTGGWIASALPFGHVNSALYRVITDNGIRSFLKQPRSAILLPITQAQGAGGLARSAWCVALAT